MSRNSPDAATEKKIAAIIQKRMRPPILSKGTIRGERVFIRDAEGAVTEMCDRRENNDLVRKKLNDSYPALMPIFDKFERAILPD